MLNKSIRYSCCGLFRPWFCYIIIIIIINLIIKVIVGEEVRRGIEEIERVIREVKARGVDNKEKR